MVLAPIVKPYVDRVTSDWLYGDWSKEKYDQFKFLYGLPGIHQYFDYLLDKRNDAAYMKNNQLDWSDIWDPRKLSQTHSYGAVLNFVSDNVKRLYKN